MSVCNKHFFIIESMFLCFSPISCAGNGRGDLGCGRGLFEFLCLEPCGHAGEFVCCHRLSLLTVWREGGGLH